MGVGGGDTKREWGGGCKLYPYKKGGTQRFEVVGQF